MDRTLRKSAVAGALALVFGWRCLIAADIEFRKLPIEQPVTAMAATEDGQFLLVGEADADRVTVVDMKTGDTIKQLSCPSPRSILCRGDKAYVANYGKGTISVFATTSWDLSDELQAGEGKVYYLTAPGGKFFKGFLLAIAEGGERPRPYRVTLIDTRKDQHREILGETHISVATADYEGRHIVVQHAIDTSPSAAIDDVYDYQKTAQIAPPAPPASRNNLPPRAHSSSHQHVESLNLRGDHRDTPILYQTGPGQLWYGLASVWKGIPPKGVGGDRGDFMIADVTRPQLFAFSGDEMKLIGVPGLSELAKQSVSWPVEPEKEEPAEEEPPKSKSSKKGRSTSRSKRSTTSSKRSTTSGSQKKSEDKKAPYQFFHDVAATLGDRVALAHFDRASQSLWFATASAPRGGSAGLASADDSSPEGGSLLPSRVAIGKPIARKLFGAKPPGTYVLVSGPPGCKLAENGELKWTPGRAERGEQNFKIKATVGGSTSFVRFTTEVIEFDPSLAADPEALASAGRHEIGDPAKIRLTYTRDGKRLLLVDGHRVSILDAAGMVAAESHEFENQYLGFQERKEYYVALTPKALVLIDKKKWEPIKQIEIDYPQVNQLAINPAEKFSYVTLTGKGGLGVDEQTDKIEEYPQLLGGHLAVDPQAHRLFSVATQAYQNGFRIDTRAHRIVPSIGRAEALLCYDIRGRVPRGESANVDPGNNVRRISLSADGRNVAYVSGGGASGQYYAIQSFKADDVAKEDTRYQIAAYPVDLAFHPTVDMVAATNGKELWFFRRTTGEALQGVLAAGRTFGEITRIFFPPAGTQLLVASQVKGRTAVLGSVPIDLKPADQATAAKGYKPPETVPRIKDPGPRLERPQDDKIVDIKVTGVAPADIESLAGAGDAELAVKEIVRANGKSVVDIRTSSGSGTGFVVGTKGYILTCAHVVAGQGKPHVLYRVDSADAKQQDVEAKIVGLDKKNDLALLKVDAPSPLPTVHLAVSTPVEPGEEVVVIGNPGLGSKILSQTVTTGVVSSAERVFDDVKYIQMSAAVNPGNSGGPMFNRRGEVIGVVSAKARIENTGFAVPIPAVLAFLGQSDAAKDSGKDQSETSKPAKKSKPPAKKSADDATPKSPLPPGEG